MEAGGGSQQPAGPPRPVGKVVIFTPAPRPQVDGAALVKRHRQGWLMEVTDSLDHCIDRLRCEACAGESGLGTLDLCPSLAAPGSVGWPGASVLPTHTVSRTSVVLRVTPPLSHGWAKTTSYVSPICASVPSPEPGTREALLGAQGPSGPAAPPLGDQGWCGVPGPSQLGVSAEISQWGQAGPPEAAPQMLSLKHSLS